MKYDKELDGGLEELFPWLKKCSFTLGFTPKGCIGSTIEKDPIQTKEQGKMAKKRGETFEARLSPRMGEALRMSRWIILGSIMKMWPRALRTMSASI